VQASFDPFRDSANLDVDRCTVCTKHTIGSETFLDAPDGTRRRRGSSASSFRCVTIGSETILDAPDGTPR